MRFPDHLVLHLTTSPRWWCVQFRGKVESWRWDVDDVRTCTTLRSSTRRSGCTRSTRRIGFEKSGNKSINASIQWGSEYRPCLDFKWSKCDQLWKIPFSNGGHVTETKKNGLKMSRFKCFGFWMVGLCFEIPNQCSKIQDPSRPLTQKLVGFSKRALLYRDKIYQCIMSQPKDGRNTQQRSTWRAGRNITIPCEYYLQ